MNPNSKFNLGQTVITATAMKLLSSQDIDSALRRHASGDWGNVCEEDQISNEEALIEGFRLVSVYESHDKITFWIITEADRSSTTVLLPSNY